MNQSIGVNAKKQLNSLMKYNRAPKRKRTSNQNSTLTMQVIKENSFKARDMMFEFADMLKDRISCVKTSVRTNGDNISFSCNSHQYNLKKRNIVIGAGVLAATALGTYAVSKAISNRH